MDVMLVVAAISCASLGTAFALLFKKLVSQTSASPLADNWDNLFNPMRYRPLERLLDGRDFDFLASQPSCGSQLVRRLRVERTSIFRGYTRCMRKDFGRILNAIKIIMVHSNVDRPDLAKLIMKQRFVFAFAMMQVECRLVMFRIGVGSVSLEAVLAPLDAIRNELRSLALVAQPVAVGAGA
jgi:hypothetical protein